MIDAERSSSRPGDRSTPRPARGPTPSTRKHRAVDRRSDHPGPTNGPPAQRVSLRRMCPVPIEAFNGRETMIARRAAPQRRVSRWSRCFPRFQCALMRAFRLDNERDVSLPNTDVDRRPRRLYSRLSASLVPAPLSSFSPRPPCVLVHVIPLVPTGTMFVGILCFTVLGIF